MSWRGFGGIPVLTAPFRERRVHDAGAWLLLLLLLLAACRPPDTVTPAGVPAGTVAAAALSFETIARECDASLGAVADEHVAPALILLDARAAADQLAGRLPAATVDQVRQVDFEEHVVLVAFFGWQPAISRECRVEGVELNGRTLQVAAQFLPAPGTDMDDQVTTPYEVISFPRPSGFGQRASLEVRFLVDDEEVLATREMMADYLVASDPAPHNVFAPVVAGTAATGTSEPLPVCTPPACAAGETYVCPGECPGGCGIVCATVTPATPVPEGSAFDGESAMRYLEAQMAFGPRYPGSEGHQAVGDYLVRELSALGWVVEIQEVPYQGLTGRNLIARANEEQEAVIILGAHYDTRRIADESVDPADRDEPVPGAVDGASGVAVLLELARTLDLDAIPAEIWLAFFDLEDNGSGGIAGWDWIVGSTYMADNLTVTPEAMVLVDMIGDADQQLYYEGNSDPALQAHLWQIAADLGFESSFIPELRYTMIDDHLPFARRGIPAVDIIDFDYPYWHTVEDTADKASAASLARVGKTLAVWLEQHLE